MANCISIVAWFYLQYMVCLLQKLHGYTQNHTTILVCTGVKLITRQSTHLRKSINYVRELMRITLPSISMV